MTTVRLTGRGIRIDDVVAVARQGAKVEIAPEALERVARARQALDRAAASGQQIYGLNTGLGANLKTAVSGDASVAARTISWGRASPTAPPRPAMS